MIIFIISLLLYPVFFSKTEYYEQMELKYAKGHIIKGDDKYYQLSRKYDRYEHYSAFLEALFLALLSGSFVYLKLPLVSIPFFVIIIWTLKDGLLNWNHGRNFFYISKSSGNPIEKFSTWYVKLILFVLSIILILKGA